MRLALPVCLLAVATLATSGLCQSDAVRQWSDSTGQFKVQASLIEQRQSDVYLKTADGKTLKIPINRLSAADQEFLKVGSNPFEVVSDSPNPASNPTVAAATSPSPSPSMSTSSQSSGSDAVISGNAPLPWSAPWQIDWEQVDLLDRGFDAQWNYAPHGSTELAFEPKPAVLPAKSNFFEGLRRLQFNPPAQRAVVGYTVSFSVPRPLSRISIIDLPTGKALNSEAVECDMCPLTILSDGQTVLMHGTGKDRDKVETGDQLQLWKVQGKKVARSGIWIPFHDDAESFGKKSHAKVVSATALPGNKVVLLGENGHVACFDAVTRQAVWHARLSRNRALEFTTDRQRMFLMDEHALLVIDPQTGKTLSSMLLPDKPNLGWPRICLNPAGDKLLMTFMNQLRVLNLATGQFDTQIELSWQGPIAPNGLSYPHDDYALLDDHILLHIPTQIVVCDYTDAAVITSEGGAEFVALLADKGGLVVPTSIPHPKAESILKQAAEDPSVFLIHPGVKVSLDVSGVGGEHQGKVEQSLREAAKQANYQVVTSAPVVLAANIKGPEQEAVSYIARGSYIATKYTTTAELLWNGKKVWSQSGTNIPGFLQTRGDETIQQKLDELGKRPDLEFFKRLGLPKMLQAPKQNQAGGNNRNALLVSKFTLQGLVDSP